jgi:biotin carboxyl carrier protein
MPAKKESQSAAGNGMSDSRVARDHQAIAHLAEDLLPALIAKLGASGLGEIEVREGEWKARLRKPAGTDRHSGHGHSRPQSPSHHVTIEERGRHAIEEEEAQEAANLPIMATSPAVGVFQPRKEIVAGAKVRAGDRIGFVDVLGVREDVVAPIDGVIGVSLVEPGEAVEYGQELIRIELPANALGLGADGTDREAAAVLGEA